MFPNHVDHSNPLPWPVLFGVLHTHIFEAAADSTGALWWAWGELVDVRDVQKGRNSDIRNISLAHSFLIFDSDDEEKWMRRVCY